MPAIDLYEFNDITALIRLLMALLASGILGMERTRKLRPAGMRTYMLVCIGACSTMLGGVYLYEMYGPGFDPARMAAQVISGIGFIGAGTIMVAPHQKVRGLTTAAGLWAVACLGINIGVGNYAIALGVFVSMLITMFLADKLEVVFFRHLRRIHVTILIQSLDVVPCIRDSMKTLDISLSNLEFAQAVENKGVSMTCFLRLKHRTHHQTAIELLENVPGVLYVELLDILSKIAVGG
jgi:putative Mg2+ transporter-C (MgtC) family protein